MSTLRISTKDPNRALSLKDYLSQHGLHVVMLSPTELEIEDGGVPAELGNEISSWQHAYDLEITVHPATHSPMQSEESWQQDEEWSDSEVPEREFVLAPQWRSAKAQAAKFGSMLAAKGQAMRGALRRGSSWLHATEERILARSSASDKKRTIAEEKAWAENPQPVESIQPLPSVPQKERIPLRQRIQVAAASIVALRSARWLTDGGKAVAFAGGIVMAGLIGIGLSVSHIDKASAGTSHPGSGSASATVVETAEPASQLARSSEPSPGHAARPAKPSPVVTPSVAAKHRASSPVVRRDEEDVAESDGPEVVTHYYHQKAVSQVQKTTYNGVKRYSDMD